MYNNVTLLKFFWKKLNKGAALVLIAWFRAGLAGLNLDYPENRALKRRKPS